MKVNQKGFSAVEILIVLVVIGLIGGAGWYVLHNRQDKNTESTTTQTNTTESTPPNLSKYDDDFVSFNYPSDWKDTSLKAADPSSTNLSLHTSILIAKNNHFGANGTTCREDCTVYYLDKVSPQSP